MCASCLRTLYGAGMVIALFLVCCCTTLRAVRRVQVSVSHKSSQGIDGRWGRVTSNATRNDLNRRTRPVAFVRCEGCVMRASTDADNQSQSPGNRVQHSTAKPTVPVMIRASTDADHRSESPGNHVQYSTAKPTVPVSFNFSALYELRSWTHFPNRHHGMAMDGVAMGVCVMGICAFFSACLICQFVNRSFETIDSNASPPRFEPSSDGEASRRWVKLPREPDEAVHYIRRSLSSGFRRTTSPRVSAPAALLRHTYEPLLASSSGSENRSDDDDEALDPPELETPQVHRVKSPKSQKKLQFYKRASASVSAQC